MKANINTQLLGLCKPLSFFKLDPKNARSHPRRSLDAIKASYTQFGQQKPVVCLQDGTLVAGNGQLTVAQELGWDQLAAVVFKDTERAKAYALADNRSAEFSDWDPARLLEAVKELQISGFDLADLGFTQKDLAAYSLADRYARTEAVRNLAASFGVPPFSVLDSKQGYWKDRRATWQKLIGNASESREETLGSNMMAGINEGVSNLDPVLVEAMLRWYCPQGSLVLDPFGGEQVKGVVMGALGYTYHGVEIRAEQVEVNRKACAEYPAVHYHQGDSNDIDTVVPGEDFDFLVTSPPYYDLEVYSAKDMSALPTYEEFMRQYTSIFKKCAAKLAPNRFMALIVGEIKNKKTGEYRGFVPDTIKALREAGLHYYMEFTYLSPAGTAPLRATKSMSARKAVKLHGNVLIFYKGNTADIPKHWPPLSMDEVQVDPGAGA